MADTGGGAIVPLGGVSVAEPVQDTGAQAPQSAGAVSDALVPFLLRSFGTRRASGSRSAQDLSLSQQQSTVMGILEAFASQRGVNIVPYDPALHDSAIFNNQDLLCNGSINENYIQARLMQLRDEMGYRGGDLVEQALIGEWRKILALLGEYNAEVPTTHHRGLKAYVIQYLNRAQKSVVPFAQIVGLIIWHDVNLGSNDWRFCPQVQAQPTSLATQLWRPVFYPDWESEAFVGVPLALRPTLFNDTDNTVEIALACAYNTEDWQNLQLPALALAFALASNNMRSRTGAIMQLPPAMLTDEYRDILNKFGFGDIDVSTAAGQKWYIGGSEVGQCASLPTVVGKAAQLGRDATRDRNGWFLLAPVEAAILLDLTKVGLRGVACVSPRSLAARVGYDPATGKRAFTSDSGVCQTGMFDLESAQNLDRAIHSLGTESEAAEPPVRQDEERKFGHIWPFSVPVRSTTGNRRRQSTNRRSRQ